MDWSGQVEVEPGWEALLAEGAATGKAQRRRLAGTLRGRRPRRGDWGGGGRHRDVVRIPDCTDTGAGLCGV